jgi:hypothetical protein
VRNLCCLARPTNDVGHLRTTTYKTIVNMVLGIEEYLYEALGGKLIACGI